MLGFFALTRLPLPEAITLNYAQPLLVVVFSALFLGETIRVYRWSAVIDRADRRLHRFLAEAHAAGRAGRHRAIRKLSASSRRLLAALSAVALLLVRSLVRTEKTATIVLWFSLTASVSALLTLPFGWEALDRRHRRRFLSAPGFCGGMAQILMTEAYRHAEASTVAPFEYTSMILGIVVGYLVFDDLPTIHMLVGGAIVVGAGIFIIWRERQIGLKRRRCAEGIAASGLTAIKQKTCIFHRFPLLREAAGIKQFANDQIMLRWCNKKIARVGSIVIRVLAARPLPSLAAKWWMAALDRPIDAGFLNAQLLGADAGLLVLRPVEGGLDSDADYRPLTAISSKASVWIAEASGELVNSIAYFHDPRNESPLNSLLTGAGMLVSLVVFKDIAFVGVRHLFSTTLHRKWRGWLNARFNAALLDANHTHFHLQHGARVAKRPGAGSAGQHRSARPGFDQGYDRRRDRPRHGRVRRPTSLFFVGQKLIETSTVVDGLEFLGNYGSAILALERSGALRAGEHADRLEDRSASWSG